MITDIKTETHLKISGKETVKKFKPGEIRSLILTGISISLLVGGMIVFPSLPIALGAIINIFQDDRRYHLPKAKVKRTLKLLEKNKLIRIERTNGEAVVHIEKKGKQIIKKYAIQSLLTLKTKRTEWKGFWYLVIFDVPEEQSNKRNELRRLLKWVGFYQYQKSVFVFPYECGSEVRLVKELVESSSYIKYIVAQEIEDEKSLKTYFNLNK